MSSTGRRATTDFRGGLGWMALGAAIVAAAWRMDRFEQMGGTLYTAPGLVPGLFGVALIALGGLLAWRGRRASASAEPAAGSAEDEGPLVNGRVLATLALTLAYAGAAVGRLPFAASTAVFVALFAGLYADPAPPLRRWGTAVLAGVLTAAAVVFVFEHLFLVRLP